MDVKNAFLHKYVDREIFIELPVWLVDQKLLEYICKLKKALYDLKQAPRLWYR